ncbi:hypothetical protein OG559_31100 (plasmid) [Micromonospora sp. NBC_01405]|uniref:hypothetical protein n=1 Tax=Micromonospora sp. NBC_01405 TaxID=2903589 RepID=UPI00324C7C3C
MGLKPESSVMIGLATAALVWSIHSNVTPTIADIRVAPPGDKDIASSRKAATMSSAAAVSAISLIAKDPTIFIIGGAMVIIADVVTRHANTINPETSRMLLPGLRQSPTQDVPAEPVFMSGE